MTIHAAKGLEVEVVFIAGCEDGLILYHWPVLKNGDADEELRLFFVANTRAKQQLFLSWARKRTIFGKTSRQRLSLFVDEVEQHFKMDMETRLKKPAQEQLSLF